ncbi:MAG: hypothetical protein ACTSO7_16040 [Candidatus Heimdallarchaeota archaeon]
MAENDEGKEPPPISKIDLDEDYSEPEDWDLPTTIIEDDEVLEFLENVEPEEALETIFENIHLSSIISLVLGILLAATFLVIEAYFHSVPKIAIMLIGFGAGLMIVFGAAEIIILGVKGMSDKLNWNPYISGILQAIGAALAELVVVIILLVRSHTTNNPDLATTAIVLILTTVIINILFLGISIVVMAKDEPFKLPAELTFFEANLILGMMVFSFVIMLYGFYYEFEGIKNLIEGGTELVTFDRVFEIVIGVSLILVYVIFLVVLVRRFGRKTSTPQTLISEFFPDEDDLVLEETISPKQDSRILKENGKLKKKKGCPSKKKSAEEKIVCKDCGMALEPGMKKCNGCGSKVPKIKKVKEEVEEELVEVPNNSKRRRRLFGNNQKSKQQRSDALATLRRFPWFIIILLFLLGAGGIVWGGELLASSIELGLNAFGNYDVPILVYSVIIGIVSSSPELVVTLRGLFSQDEEDREVGLVHQVSAINQTFFILFGVPFVISGIFNIGIPIAIEIMIVMGGIFIISAAEVLMIADDNAFDLFEGIVIIILSIVSLLALALIGGASTSEVESTAQQLAHIAKLL